MAQESSKVNMEETGCQSPEGPIYCANNCGFFGSKSTMNMCSKCYKAAFMVKAKTISEEAAPGTVTASNTPTPVVLDATTADTQARLALAAVNVSSNKLVQNTIYVNSSQEASPSHSKNRCFSCNKRVGLVGFKCRCENTFCSLHRYSDKHNCPFDYKATGREAIAKANPVIKADKVRKI